MTETATTDETGESKRVDTDDCEHGESLGSLDQQTREEILADYNYRCQTCGRRGPQGGGIATLHVHHIDPDPTNGDRHDPGNLTVLCRSCHIWIHERSTPEDSPVELSNEDLQVLLTQDIEILEYLADNGPASTGDVAAALSADYSLNSVRQRLWTLMGLDHSVESRDHQVIGKDAHSGEWGLLEQIETPSRGRIPDDQQLLIQRVEDERVRRAIERGCDRGDVQEVLDLSRRTTFDKVKRARAYGFPLSAFGRGGRPNEQRRDEDSPPTTPSDGDGDVDAARAVPSKTPEETWKKTHSPEPSDSEPTGENGHEGDDDIHEQVEQAIAALRDVNEVL